MNGSKKIHKIIISGAGPVGLLSCLALAHEGISSLCIHPPHPREDKQSKDQRTVALLQSSVNMLKHLDLWQDLVSVASPLETLKICDRTGGWPAIPDTLFKASEIELEAFAYNMPLAHLVKVMREKAENNELISFHSTGGVQKADCYHTHTALKTSDGSSYKSQLVIAADGPASHLRKAARIGARHWQYNQTAIACHIRHQKPHFNISTEFHFNHGPLVLVPMEGYHSAIVWVVPPEKAEHLLQMSKEGFNHQLNTAIEGLMGEISLISNRSSFPLGGMTADRFADKRVLLTGHAAHMIPPIGAQGLNLGFRDVATLGELLSEAIPFGDDPGETGLLKTYDSSRRKDILSRTFGVDMLNRSLLWGKHLPVHLLRGSGLALLRNILALRKSVMRQGLGADLELPEMMKNTS